MGRVNITFFLFSCLRNCGGPDFRINPSRPVYLHVSLFQGLNLPANSVIKWSYSKHGTTELTTFNSTSSVLIIPAGFLVEREIYKITAVRKFAALNFCLQLNTLHLKG